MRHRIYEVKGQSNKKIKTKKNDERNTSRAGFTHSGPLFKNVGPLLYEYPPTPLVCLHQTRTVVIIDILLTTLAAMHTTTRTVFNFLCFCGPPFCGGLCSAEHAEHA